MATSGPASGAGRRQLDRARPAGRSWRCGRARLDTVAAVLERGRAAAAAVCAVGASRRMRAIPQKPLRKLWKSGSSGESGSEAMAAVSNGSTAGCRARNTSPRGMPWAISGWALAVDDQSSERTTARAG